MAGESQAADVGRVIDFGVPPWSMPGFQRAFMVKIMDRSPAVSVALALGIREPEVIPYLNHLREIGVAPRRGLTAVETDAIIMRVACEHGRVNATECLIALAAAGSQLTKNAVIGRVGRIARRGATMPDGRPLEAIRMPGALAGTLKARGRLRPSESIEKRRRYKVARIRAEHKRQMDEAKAALRDIIRGPGRRAPSRTTLAAPQKGTCLWVFRAGGHARWCGKNAVPGTCWCPEHHHNAATPPRETALTP